MHGARAAGLAVSTSIAFAARSREGVGGRGKEGLGESGTEGSRGGSRIGSWRGVDADPKLQERRKRCRITKKARPRVQDLVTLTRLKQSCTTLTGLCEVAERGRRSRRSVEEEVVAGGAV